jgi:hypothetical protein
MLQYLKRAYLEFSAVSNELGHLNQNPPSDQLSWRTPCRTFVYEAWPLSCLNAREPRV